MKQNTALESNDPSPSLECLPPEESSEISDEVSAENFIRCVETGIKCWEFAGQVLVQLRAKDPSIFAKLCAKAKWLTADTLWVFHRIGEGKLYPQIALMRKCPAEPQLLLADVRTQKLLCTSQIDVVVAIKNDKAVIEKRWVQELGKESIGVVFNNGNIRDVEAQEKLMRVNRQPPKVTTEPANDHVDSALADPVKFMKMRQMRSLGHYAVSWDKAEPKLVKLRGSIPANAQQITISESNSAVIELRKWVEG